MKTRKLALWGGCTLLAACGSDITGRSSQSRDVPPLPDILVCMPKTPNGAIEFSGVSAVNGFGVYFQGSVDANNQRKGLARAATQQTVNSVINTAADACQLKAGILSHRTPPVPSQRNPNALVCYPPTKEGWMTFSGSTTKYGPPVDFEGAVTPRGEVGGKTTAYTNDLAIQILNDAKNQCVDRLHITLPMPPNLSAPHVGQPLPRFRAPIDGTPMFNINLLRNEGLTPARTLLAKAL